MGKESSESTALGRTLAVLEAVLDHAAPEAADTDGPAAARSPTRSRRGDVSAIARAIGIPVSTAHRHVLTLVEAGLLHPIGRGRHVAGPRLRRLARRLDMQQILVVAAAGPLDALAGRTRSIAQLGSLDDNMVTYRLKTGHGADQLFTRVGMQMEAYCSGIGKVLLAHLPEEQQKAYLADGPFPRLTDRTITDPAALADELAKVREQDFAIDDGEIAPDLRCFAVPVRDRDGNVVAAVSLSIATSARVARELGDEALIAQVRAAVSEIEATALG